MRQHLPNLLTVLRLILAAVFFVVLNQYRYAHNAVTWPLWWSMALFILASITDWLDGYLARRWRVETTFGRIMDPFCDKVLVIGALIYLAGPRFVDPELVQQGDFLTMVSGIYPWMIAVVLARELLVTGIRGEMEARGVQFGAKLSGKLKTILQLVIIPIILAIVALDPHTPDHRWMAVVRTALVYATVIVTVVSGVPYVTSAAALLRGQKPDR
jgi:CDP-diacylglycerol--glycerol-3-phosphate 3-phosphatidyltransferase